ncbi:MAG TPA: ATP synthase F1 subunit gamma [Myxococcota bacterium]|nr:ATP synthase F1 subunit gamma [Myxococcota bacterium]HON25194.1 ATP synthase F1 subunit gamma [Myxococcota bacterium]HOS62541.1 ATP synthase F1 subunit gamma [Myxococcota bacterium]HPC92255.1 ATP synthase F1 subunit gamma [Myxococcota bacterium]HPL25669.1 ATP synthase F1 subunit gamma [Myxococcota bacterium]
MATLKQIRRRLTSVRNTQKITRAMKLVATAKLRRAQENMTRAKPYARRLRKMIWDVSERSGEDAHRLLEVREEKKALLIVITSDRGMCGAFNSNINKRAEKYLRENENGHEQVALALLGRKGRDYFRRRPYSIDREYMEVLSAPSFESVCKIGDEIKARYLDGNLDAVYIVYNEFKSAMSQNVVVERFLPIIPERDSDESANPELEGIEFAFEPTMELVLDSVLPLYINVRLYFAVLESLAAEMGARMTAMEAATENAGELLTKLTMQYNKARQAMITNEMLEIVSGAEALK